MAVTDSSGKSKSVDNLMPKPMSKLGVVLLVLGTNIFTLLFSGQFSNLHTLTSQSSVTIPQHTQFSAPVTDLLAKLNRTEKELVDLKSELKSDRDLSQKLLARVAQLYEYLNTTLVQGAEGNGDRETDQDDPWLQWAGANHGSLPAELRAFIDAEKLPLGYNPNIGSDTIYPPIGHACALLKDDLARYMDYKPGTPCPDDEVLAQKLMLRGCEPLPRRRCLPRSTPNYKEPFPFPKCMWTTPPNSSVVWTAYTCKDYACLIDRKNQPGFDDCKDCFDLQHREKTRWLHPGGDLDYSIAEVLALKKGTIRIGLDIGGGTATFAVRMRERNVTIVTTSMNFNGPFNNFIASRGFVPLYITVTQRLPFFDNTLDIVHSMHVLSNWIPTQLLEFILYDIYRILRPGGVFWLDHFFCIEHQLDTYVPMIEKLGYNKLKWSVGRKLDRGAELKEMYISALLEKPLKRH
ncbi:hypothetical protein SUGI_1035890 [Cryptomeria japonica]|uniref:probable methyltransferase At1g29790 n=1 Tax=Cryptomeria japonica TaxID=3369 RepID=UPI0024147E96|nr:probable methyltransferase At1g29790 [Cryptomeria japonica]GLJ49101.1 hypothetical protein SUGI_1035890 [Cryptomeria japonica]